MKKFLPNFLIICFVLVALVYPAITFAQPQNPGAQPGQVNQQQQPAGRQPPPEGLWVVDPEVTFIGKNAARSGNLLDWTLRNYNWVCVKQAATNNINQYQCDDTDNPLARFWLLIVSFIVVPLLFIVILATAIVIIITRGKSLTIMKFIPRFIAVIVLIVFSYSLLQFLYQFTDVIQGFFLRSDAAKICPPDCISQKDLLYVGWDYRDFIGLRLLHDYYAESAFMALLLTKLTALTYFVMVGILLMRKIILWFFIIVSPIFPLLLLYYPVRNTGKIWIGEFFRWLLYAPLFAMFLNGLVYMWRQQIPLLFIPPGGTGAIGNKAEIIYPTAVNILLGGPKQFVTPDNSVNLTETFALYVVALIMLWVVILLPWILLQIFLDYASNFSPGESAVMKTLVNLAGNKPALPPAGGGGAPSPSPTGAAIALPFTKKFQLPQGIGPTGAAKEMVRETATTTAGAAKPVSAPTGFATGFATTAFAPSAQVNAQVLSLANVSVPSLKDVAKFDTASYSRDTSRQTELNQAKETLEKIANPAGITNTVEREKFSDIRDKLTKESMQGNVLATSILNAANASTKTSSANSSTISSSQMQSILQQIANPASASTNTTSVVNRDKMTQLHDMLQRESKENNSELASSLLSVSEKTSANEIEKIKEQLSNATNSTATQNSTVANSVVSQLSSALKSSDSIKESKSVLQQIANPTLASNPIDREKYTKLHEALEKDSKENNNQLASSILTVSDKTSVSELQKIQQQMNQQIAQGNSTMSSVNSAVQTSQIKKVMQQIANPASIPNTVEREKYTKLHDALAKESKENNNSLASTILQVNDKTTTEQIEKLKDSIYQAKDSTVASSVMSTINSAVSQQKQTTQVKSVLQQVANPASATSPVDREKLTKLQQSLSKASAEGNDLAASILKVTDKTSMEDIQKIQDKIQQAKSKGDKLGTELASMTQSAVKTPAVNRVQTVSKEDYEAVKTMWKENYNNLEVPQGMAGSREGWIKDDIGKIDKIISQLSSTDQEKVQAGMDEVANILPFLLMGGFSQTEIVAYLKAKQDAAKEVVTELAADEDTKVSVSTQAAHAEKTMAANLETTTSSTSSSSVSSSSEETESPLANISTTATTNFVTPQVSNEILAMVDLKLPKMRDVVRYETRSMTNDTAKVADVTKMHSMLEKIANPTAAAEGPDRTRFVQLRDKLLEASSQGNVTAQVVLSAAESAAKAQAPIVTTPVQMKSVLQQIAAPASAATEINKKKFADLHEKLEKASKEGNELAGALLNVKETTPVEEVEKLKTRLAEAKQKGEPLATEVLSNVAAPVALPKTNRMQQVSQEELDEVRNLWKENYTNLEVPQGMAGSREEWIKDDIAKIDHTVGLLTSGDEEKVNQGIEEVSNILPFLLMGGYSQEEIVSYLKAKQDAAKEVVTAMAADEETKVAVGTQQAAAQQTMAANIESSSSSVSSTSDETGSPLTNISTTATTNIVTPQVSNEILAMVDLKLPKMRDVVKYETRSLTKDSSQIADVQKVHSMLEKIANPATVSEGPDRERFVQLREKLLDESTKGNITAQVVLSAADKTVTLQGGAPSHVSVKAVLTQIAAPATAVNEVNKKRFNDLHDKLAEASKGGNELATSLLNVTDKTSVEDVEKIRTKLEEAKQKGEPLATEVLSSVSGAVTVPSTNVLQQVTPEEYQEVKTLWKENYTKLEVPQGMAGTREEWIKDDISKIDSTVGLLTSADQEKVSQGINEVSNILPFLLMGGYSQSEIVSYLKAKQEAAQEVLQSMSAEEATQVTVENKQQTQTAAQAMAVATPAASGDSAEVSPLANGAAVSEVANLITPQVTNEIMALVNLKLPKIRDVAQYDAVRFSKNADHTAETQKMQQVLSSIADPTTVEDAGEREKFVKLREKLVEESQKGNVSADVVLTAASGSLAAQTDPVKATARKKAILKQLANPSLATNADKVRLTKLHDEIAQAKEQGNPLAAALLTVQDATPPEEIEKISNDLAEAKKNGDALATAVLDKVEEPTEVPGSNRVQHVGPEEFEEVKKMWLENYLKLPVPPEFGEGTKGRMEWIKKEMTEIQDIIAMLLSSDPEKKKEGLKRVSALLPFLLLGGFSLPEMVAYLKAKLDAAKEAIATLEKDESNQVTVDANNASAQAPQAMAAPVEGEKKES